VRRAAGDSRLDALFLKVSTTDLIPPPREAIDDMP
jgi:hypothetical protein